MLNAAYVVGIEIGKHTRVKGKTVYSFLPDSLRRDFNKYGINALHKHLRQGLLKLNNVRCRIRGFKLFSVVIYAVCSYISAGNSARGRDIVQRDGNGGLSLSSRYADQSHFFCGIAVKFNGNARKS
jgi:hypothetical protein